MVASPVFFDETLRDGEQQAGVFLSFEQKRELAHLIARTGVSHLDLMPAVDEGEAALTRSLVKDGLGQLVSAATPVGRSFVDQAKACGVRRIVLFYATSDRLLYLRDAAIRQDGERAARSVDAGLSSGVVRGMRQRALDNVLDCIRYATSADVGLEVDFAAEDASRADAAFLVEFLRQIAPHVGHVLLCDTVGVLRPEVVSPWIGGLRAAVPQARFGVHFHNDRGLALENTLEALRAGATLVSGTFGGIGERAGNVALEQVDDGLRVCDGGRSRLDPDAVAAVSTFLADHRVAPAPPYSRAAQRHMSGMHVHCLLLDPMSYSSFPDSEPEIWFGKVSGASNFQYLYERRLGRSLPRAAYEQLSAALKRRVREEGRCFSSDEVLALLRAGAFDRAA